MTIQKAKRNAMKKRKGKVVKLRRLYRYRTVREFVEFDRGYEMGMIQAWEHVRVLCRGCIKAHREMLVMRNIRQRAYLNSHLIEELDNPTPKKGRKR